MIKEKINLFPFIEPSLTDEKLRKTIECSKYYDELNKLLVHHICNLNISKVEQILKIGGKVKESVLMYTLPDELRNLLIQNNNFRPDQIFLAENYSRMKPDDFNHLHDTIGQDGISFYTSAVYVGLDAVKILHKRGFNAYVSKYYGPLHQALLIRGYEIADYLLQNGFRFDREYILNYEYHCEETTKWVQDNLGPGRLTKKAK